MDLFSDGAINNLLPYDGTVEYYGPILSRSESDHFLHHLLENIAWKNDEAVIFGKKFITKRKVAWYADKAFSYTYSNTTKEALPWAPELLDLKQRVEQLTGETFNSCLLNLYHDGSESMAYHSDDEKALGRDSAIGSLSFGAERKFLLKHKTTKATVGLILEHGSLLVMRGTTQTHWMHRLPPTTKVKTARVNLTFRKMVE